MSWLDKEIDALNARFPDMRNARDIIEHFDEYTKGKGHLQKKAPQPWQYRLSWDIHVADGLVLLLEPGIRLDVNAITKVATEIAGFAVVELSP